MILLSPNLMTMTDSTDRAKFVNIAFLICVGACIVSVLSNAWEYVILDAAEVNGLDMEEAEANDLRQQFIGLSQIAVYLACVVTFMLWFYRVYSNLHDLGSTGVTYGKGWAVGSWFVPFLNLVRPYQIMKEIWQEHHFIVSGDAAFSNTLISVWWGSFIVSGALDRLSKTIFKGADSLGAFKMLAGTFIVGDLVNLIGAVCVLLIVRRVSALEAMTRAGEIRSDFLHAGVSQRT